MSYPYSQGQSQPYPENYSTPTTPHTPYQQWEQSEHDPRQPTPPEGQQQQQILQEQHQEQHHQAYSNTPTPIPNPSIPPIQVIQLEQLPPVRPRIDTARSLRTSTSPLSSTTPLRHTSASGSTVRAHPYRRPLSAASNAVASIRQQAQPWHLQRDLSQHVRFADMNSALGLSLQGATSTSGAGTSSVGTSSRVASYGSANTSSPITNTARQETTVHRSRTLTPRTDVFYDSMMHVVTAFLELPGIKRDDLSVRLSTSYYNRLRQVTISGRNRSFGADSVGNATIPCVEERKVGAFSRSFVVPPETKPEDIQAELQDGILILKMSCGPPAEDEDAHDIAIR